MNSYRLLIEVKGGSGGSGIVSFNHLPAKPKAGPDGGNGGKGGDVFIKASEEYHSLDHLHRTSCFRAEAGENGGKNKKHGGNGKDLMIYVPVGTTVYKKENERLLADLTKEGEKVKVAEGGSGGKGNINFTTSTNQAPRIATSGEEGENNKIELIFKPKVNIAVVGPPNSGKSSLIACITGKNLEIASYPFSTRKPHLWTCLHNFSRFSFLDTPPLVSENVEEIKLLISRATTLLVVLDSTQGGSLKRIQPILNDVERYFKEEKDKKIAFVMTKTDKKEVSNSLPVSYPVFFVSVEREEGLDRLKEFIFQEK